MERNDRLVNSVTVDLDNPNPVEITIAWNILAKLGADRVRGRLSSSKQGVHLEASGLVDGERLAVHIRRMSGDDPERVGKDIEKGWRPSQVTFDSKDGKEAGPWVDCPFNLVDQYLYHNEVEV